MPKIRWMGFSRDNTPLPGCTERGATLSADADLLVESPTAATYFQQQAVDVLGAGRLLNVSVFTNGDGENVFAHACSLLRDALASAGASGEQVGLVVSSGALPIARAWRIRRRTLGEGPLFVVTRAGARRAQWAELWELRNIPQVRAAFADEITSPCELLPAECANAVIPGSDVQAPVASAWVTASLHLPDYACSRGRIDECGLIETARCLVDSADGLHADCRWPTPRMRYDSWLNRRVGIDVTGIGSLLQRQDRDPGDFATLEGCSKLLALVRAALVQRSRELAATYGPLAALDQPESMPALADARLREGWLQRWRSAVDATALRHRNLLIISPWALFPDAADADYRYADLLPLLRYADACSCPSAPQLSGWNLRKFSNFYQRAGAVIQQRSAQCQIAEPA